MHKFCSFWQARHHNIKSEARLIGNFRFLIECHYNFWYFRNYYNHSIKRNGNLIYYFAYSLNEGYNFVISETEKIWVSFSLTSMGIYLIFLSSKQQDCLIFLLLTFSGIFLAIYISNFIILNKIIQYSRTHI